MIRKIIKIDENLCDGCGLCASACHEEAIGIVNGKAKLLRDDYCDGLGDCLPACPTGAITFVEREAAAYDEAAVKAKSTRPAPARPAETQLRQWPVQIKLMPPNAPYLNGADLLVAADCAAYAYGDFHNGFMNGRITVIGCPKLDEGDYSEKLTAVLKMNDIKSVTVARMEVPCCGGIVNAVKTALKNCGKPIPLTIATITTDGQILEG